jgi:FkbM family methyltransferase
LRFNKIRKYIQTPDNTKRDNVRKDIYYYTKKLYYCSARLFIRIINNQNILNNIRTYIISRRSFLPKELVIMKGDTVIQVGTHKQETLSRIYNSIGSNGKAIIIEADKNSYEYLNEYIQKNNWTNMILVHKAASNIKGEGSFLISEILSDHRLEDSNILHDNDLRSDGYINENIVQIDTIDNILSDLKIDKVDYIEITVNGAELKVLEGMKNSLKITKRIYTKTYAIDLENNQTLTKEIIRILRRNDFNFIIGRPSQSVIDEQWGKRSGDIYAFKKE